MKVIQIVDGIQSIGAHSLVFKAIGGFELFEEDGNPATIRGGVCVQEEAFRFCGHCAKDIALLLKVEG
jgi:hypothetical protein